MIVTDKWIFVHVPKNGGQSVERALGIYPKMENMHRPLFLVDKGDRQAFGFVRNPWDRMVSLFAFNQSWDVGHGDFKAWLTKGRYFGDHDENWPGHPPHQRRSQMWWLDGCDFIGRFENIDDDFLWACHAFGMVTGSLPHINDSNHDHYSIYYDDESRAFVAEHFAPEIERFGYKFEEHHD